MRSGGSLVSVRYAVERKARLGLIVLVAAGVAASFWIWFFRNLARTEEQT
ncbi:MAG: hypothetical protein JSR61_04690 [Proteobacteria bacterium]|nr:hypothetical protein [Pseudomonadota bacterium]